MPVAVFPSKCRFEIVPAGFFTFPFMEKENNCCFFFLHTLQNARLNFQKKESTLFFKMIYLLQQLGKTINLCPFI